MRELERDTAGQESVPSAPHEVYVGGTIVPVNQAVVSVEDRGFQFGDGLYEVVRVYGAQPFRFDSHLERLRRGAQFLELNLGNEGLDEIRSAAQTLIERSHLREAIVVVQVTRGVAPRSHLPPDDLVPTIVVYVRPAPLVATNPLRSIRAITSDDTRWAHCDIKVTGLLPNVLAKMGARRAGAEDAIFIRDGHVTDSPACNVFAVFQGSVKTPPKTNYILHGVTRDVVLEICGKEGIAHSEELIRVEDLRKADEIFLSGTTDEVLPVIELDGRSVGTGGIGDSTQAIAIAFRALVRRGND